MEFNFINEILVKESKFVELEHKFYRTGNPKYKITGNKEIINLQSVLISDMMNTSISFSMLITSKRINIHYLCNELMQTIEKENPFLQSIILRTLIERISYYYYFYRQVSNFPIPKEVTDNNINHLHNNLLPKLVKGLFQTSLEMRHLGPETDIRTLKLLPYEVKNDDAYDRSTLNILTPVNQLDKKIKGIKNMYGLLSELLHPNYGDLENSSISIVPFENEDGDVFIERKMKQNKNTTILWKSFYDQFIDIINESCNLYLKTIPTLEKYLLDLKIFSKNYVHQEIKKRGLKYFKLRKGSKCPCLSGYRVKDCNDFL